MPRCTRWHAAVYLTMAVILAFISISMSLRSEPKNETLKLKPTGHFVSLSASRTLRRTGFTTMATLLQLSPELFFSSSANTTFFAIKDSAISNASLPPRLLKSLLQYHTSPLKLSMEDLLNKPQGTCLPTLYQKKNIAITKVHEKEKLVQINHVLVSHPNLFLEGPISIHGVIGSFADLDLRNVYQGWDVIQSPACDSNSNMASDVPPDLKSMVEWSWIIRLLSSNGFVSFAIGLHSVLDGILGDHKGVKSVTILVPPSLELEAYPSPVLEKIVRFHILPERFTNTELESLPGRTLLRTLLHGQPLEVTDLNFMQGLVINGVKIVAPDILSSKTFIVHGISRALEPDDLPNKLR